MQLEVHHFKAEIILRVYRFYGAKNTSEEKCSQSSLADLVNRQCYMRFRQNI